MQSVADGSPLHGVWHLTVFRHLAKLTLKFWVHHQAMHSLTLEMVREFSHRFLSYLGELSRCEIYHRGIVPHEILPQPPIPYATCLLRSLWPVLCVCGRGGGGWPMALCSDPLHQWWRAPVKLHGLKTATTGTRLHAAEAVGPSHGKWGKQQFSLTKLPAPPPE